MSVEQRLDEICARVTELTTMPNVYFRVREVIADSDSSASSLAEVLSTDPAMTSSVLRVANSALYSLPRKVEHMVQAISLLGMQAVHDMALVSALGATFSRWTVDALDMERFWRRSVCAALAAKAIAVRLGQPHIERHFVDGLLHEVGHIALGQVVPEELQQVLSRVELESNLLARTEQEALGFDYARLGARLLERWNLPESIVRAVRNQVCPDPEDPQALAAAIVHVAREVACAVVAEQSMSARYAEIPLSVLRILCLDSADFEAVRDQVAIREAQTIRLLFPRLHNRGLGRTRARR
ncbi:MAG: HDOD domain-containing protein [Gammaproteobacteria bacterium]|nr:HDOD domain-containing protein [Gammaproteobacteria bacterium]